MHRMSYWEMFRLERRVTDKKIGHYPKYRLSTVWIWVKIFWENLNVQISRNLFVNDLFVLRSVYKQSLTDGFSLWKRPDAGWLF